MSHLGLTGQGRVRVVNVGDIKVTVQSSDDDDFIVADVAPGTASDQVKLTSLTFPLNTRGNIFMRWNFPFD